MADDLVERIARAMEPSGFETFDRRYTCHNYIAELAFLNAERTAKIARRKARRVVEAIRSAGLVIVPREPTAKMVILAGDVVVGAEPEFPSPDSTSREIWRAMIAASEEH